MDTSNFQDLGNSPNPSNDLHAGEFAKPSLVSPVSPLGAASIGSLVRITEDYRPEQVEQIGIISAFYEAMNFYDVVFSFGAEHYEEKDFELVLPSSNSSKDIQLQLVSHLNALLAVPLDVLNIPALLFVSDKLQALILHDDDGIKRHGLDPDLLRASQLLRFGFEDLTNSTRFGRRVAHVFHDAAFEKLKRAAVILNADSVGAV